MHKIILIAAAAGWLYCLLGFVAIAWSSDRSMWVDRCLREGSTTRNSVTLFAFMLTWPGVLVAALPGIALRARQRRKQAI